MAEFLEILMVVSFGASWPFNVVKSYRSRTAKGKSLAFLMLIFTGYVCGSISKLLTPSFKWYVLFFYVLNLLMVGVDLILYFRNRKIEQQ